MNQKTCTPPKGQAISDKSINKGLFGWKFGISPMELSMDVQSKSSYFIGDFLCAQLKKLGKDITIYRLEQKAPSVEQIKFLSIDQADEQTCSMLVEMGKKDGEEIYGKIIRENKNNFYQFARFSYSALLH